MYNLQPSVTQLSIESLLGEISSRGWRVNNLYQLDDNSWAANLRSDTHITHFAYGSSLTEALSLCIDKIESAEESEAQETKLFRGDLPRINLRSILRPQTFRRI